MCSSVKAMSCGSLNTTYYTLGLSGIHNAYLKLSGPFCGSGENRVFFFEQSSLFPKKSKFD